MVMFCFSELPSPSTVVVAAIPFDAWRRSLHFAFPTRASISLGSPVGSDSNHLLFICRLCDALGRLADGRLDWSSSHDARLDSTGRDPCSLGTTGTMIVSSRRSCLFEFKVSNLLDGVIGGQ